MPDFVLVSFTVDASRRPELEVVLLPVLPESVAPETSVCPLLFRPELFCATLLEEPLPSLRVTFVPDERLCPY